MKKNDNKKNNNKIKFGLIGCGQISVTHFACLTSLPQAELVAVCDIKEDRAKGAGEKYGVDWYCDYRKLLMREDVDVVSICTPHHLHVPMGIAAAMAGKHALMEKPIGLESKGVDKMLEVFGRKKKKIFSVLQVRYNPPVLELKRLLEEKRLGSINNVALVLRWFRPQVYFEKDDWRGDKKKDGGLLFSQGSHYLDILRWFFGPADSVFGKAATVGHKITMDDMVTAVIKFQNGAYATIELTLCTYPSNIECSLSILGERGSIKVAGSALDKIEFWKVDGLEQPDLASGIAPNVYAGGLYQGSCPNHIFIYKNVIKCLLGKKPDKPYIDGREARKFVELAEAIYKSSRTGKEIFLS